MDVDNINRGAGHTALDENSGEYTTINAYIDGYNNGRFAAEKTYRLMGEINVGLQTNRYL
jgi:hypothetical protein